MRAAFDCDQGGAAHYPLLRARQGLESPYCGLGMGGGQAEDRVGSEKTSRKVC